MGAVWNEERAHPSPSSLIRHWKVLHALLSATPSHSSGREISRVGQAQLEYEEQGLNIVYLASKVSLSLRGMKHAEVP